MNIEFAYIPVAGITDENLQFYKEHGFLIAENFLTAGEVLALKKETVAIFRGERGEIEGLLPVKKGESDSDVLKKYTAIHFPHKISWAIQVFLSQVKIVSVLKRIIGPDIKCMQSMLFVKGPGKAGQSWHQDEFYIPTRDRSLTGAWIAIDDADRDNGCLWIIPGRPGYIMQRVPGQDQEFADVDGVDVSTSEKDAIPVEVKSGGVVCFNGYTLHCSRRNHTTGNFRMALVNHYMSSGSMLPWDQDGKLPATEDLRDILVIAGTDPYEWKGTTNVNRPFLRPGVLNIKTGRS